MSDYIDDLLSKISSLDPEQTKAVDFIGKVTFVRKNPMNQISFTSELTYLQYSPVPNCKKGGGELLGKVGHFLEFL